MDFIRNVGRLHAEKAMTRNKIRKGKKLTSKGNYVTNTVNPPLEKLERHVTHSHNNFPKYQYLYLRIIRIAGF